MDLREKRLYFGCLRGFEKVRCSFEISLFINEVKVFGFFQLFLNEEEKTMKKTIVLWIGLSGRRSETRLKMRRNKTPQKQTRLLALNDGVSGLLLMKYQSFSSF